MLLLVWGTSQHGMISRNVDFLRQPEAGQSDRDGLSHVAGVEDLQVAKATYLAARQRWPETPINLAPGHTRIEDSRGLGLCKEPGAPPRDPASTAPRLLHKRQELVVVL
jgi:hypothetical protein